MDKPRKIRKGWDEPGHAHFLTFSCFQRLPLLRSDRTRRWVINAMRDLRTRHDVALWAYVIMPEHVHVLLCPRAAYQMKQILGALKKPVSHAARAHLEEMEDDRWLDRLTVEYPSGPRFRFWQPGGGHDHNIVQTGTADAVARYIHHNPVRRGLCEHPIDWPWSSARFWEGEDYILAMDAWWT